MDTAVIGSLLTGRKRDREKSQGHTSMKDLINEYVSEQETRIALRKSM